MNGTSPLYCRTCGQRIEPRHVDECPPSTVGAARAEFRGPSDLEATGEMAAAALEALPEDGSGLYLEPLAVYRYAEGGDLPAMLVCGECLRLAGEALDTRAVGARTAGTCTACGRDGAPARWSEALRGAAYWRALVLAFEPERASHGRPGIRSPRWRSADLEAGETWATIARCAREDRDDREARPVVWTGAQFVRAVLEAVPGVPVRVDHSGGGCATLYAGEPLTVDGDTRYPFVVGPGWYEGDRGARFGSDECYAGPDDDGETAPAAVRSLDDLRALARFWLT
jgi:hypothetical protein